MPAAYPDEADVDQRVGSKIAAMEQAALEATRRQNTANPSASAISG